MDFRGMSIPYARSLPWVTTNSVNRVPGKPKMKLITFHNAVPMPCARIPVKLKFAKIQMADTPPSAAGKPDELISIDSARHVNTTDAAANAHRRRAHRSKKSRCVRGEVNISLTILTPGIGRDAAAHVFERFFRADKARSRGNGGFGLGLAIVKWIAESHRGAVELASRPGTGSTFTVTLPR
jgi:two-component system sensor histidine kinase SenX3